MDYRDYRAEKRGFAAEVQKKVNGKYSEQLAQATLEWIKIITEEDINCEGDMDNFYQVLKDGALLCRLVNCMQAGCIGRTNQPTTPFKCMANIGAFLEAAKAFGVPTQATFQTVDLWERQNLHSVVMCLQSLGRKAGKFGKPSIGPMEAVKKIWQKTN